MDNVNYSSNTVPNDYKCSRCNRHGVKLWREYNTFGPALFCVRCAIKCQAGSKTAKGLTLEMFDSEGMHHAITDRMRTDQIGCLVPAVPDEEGVGYWGYTSVPQEGVDWWKHLPLQ